MQTKPNWKLCFHMGKRSRWLQAQPCCYYMAGATSHKLGVDLMIIWVGDVGGKREGRGKRVGRSYPDLTDQPSPDVNPRLVTVKWRGLSSSAVCGRSHRWKKKISLSSLKSQWSGWWWGGWDWKCKAEQISTCESHRPCLPTSQPTSGMSTPTTTRPLHNTRLWRACGINTENRRPATVAHSTHTQDLWGSRVGVRSPSHMFISDTYHHHCGGPHVSCAGKGHQAFWF